MPHPPRPRHPPPRLTQKFVDSLPLGEPYTVRDLELKGFVVRVGRTSKAYAVQRELWVGERGARVRTRVHRETIARTDEMACDDARAKAMVLLADLRRGVDPKAAAAPARVWTVGEAYAEYARERPGQERTTRDMRDRLQRYLPDWRERPINSITALEMRERYQAIQAGVQARARRKGATGARAANQTLGDFRAVWRLAAGVFKLADADSPTRGVGKRAKEQPTPRVIAPGELAAWWQAVQALPRRDMHLLGVLTGLRPANLVGIERAWVDFDRSVIAFPARVMKGRREFDMPISAPIADVLRRCMVRAEVLHPGSPWLFPARSRDGRSVIPTRTWSEDGVITGHGLRHTYSNVAEIVGVPNNRRLLLLAQRVPGIAGRYLTDRALWGELLEAQGRVSARVMQLIAG